MKGLLKPCESCEAIKELPEASRCKLVLYQHLNCHNSPPHSITFLHIFSACSGLPEERGKPWGQQHHCHLQRKQRGHPHHHRPHSSLLTGPQSFRGIEMTNTFFSHFFTTLYDLSPCYRIRQKYLVHMSYQSKDHGTFFVDIYLRR